VGTRVALLLALLLPAAAESKPRVWVAGEVVDIGRPARQTRASPDPHISTNPWQTPYPLASIAGGPWRVYVIRLGEDLYAATGEEPARKSYLGGLKPGDPIKAMVRGGNLYLLDPRGKEHRLRVRERLKQ